MEKTAREFKKYFRRDYMLTRDSVGTNLIYVFVLYEFMPILSRKSNN
jgi:hypothetical protein